MGMRKTSRRVPKLKIEIVRTLDAARGGGQVAAAVGAPGAKPFDTVCDATRHLSGCAGGASD
jgi:hypothetical protein